MSTRRHGRSHVARLVQSQTRAVILAAALGGLVAAPPACAAPHAAATIPAGDVRPAPVMDVRVNDVPVHDLPVNDLRVNDLRVHDLRVHDLRSIAPALAACWHPPHEGDTITLRLSLRRDGSLIGRPRITYSQAVGGPEGAADLANSIFAALAACTPLPITPQLGAAVAGRVLLIRFIAQRHEQKA